MVDEKEKEKVKSPPYTSVPYDPRFPNTNQTKNCFQNYLDYHRCTKKRGKDYETCKFFEKTYKIICPSEWIEKWDDKVAEGVFPGKI